MIVFAAFTPHSPLLLPDIGKSNLEKLKKTSDAVNELAQELYLTRPDTILIISGHSKCYKDVFSICMNDHYVTDLSSLGNLTSEKEYKPDIALIDQLQRQLRRQETAFTFHPDEILDYGSSVPLLLLSEKMPDVKIIPVSPSNLGPKEHFKFGQALKDILINSTRRVAIIASGDLSHALTTDSPAGYDQAGSKFDKRIQELVTSNNAAGLIKLNPELVKNAAQCGYRALLIIYGILDKQNIKTEILNYEAPLGVGYLTTNFKLL